MTTERSTAYIIIVGNEILNGQIQDTNSHYLAKMLTSLGVEVKRIVVVPDFGDEIIEEVRLAIQRKVTYLLTSGGLGPTYDDKTIASLAKALNLELHLNEEALKIVQERYKDLYEKKLVETPDITESRKKMAYFPIGGKPLYNSVGTAPGLQLKVPNTETLVFSMPGVPRELTAMFENEIMPILREKEKKIYIRKIIPVKGITESLLAPRIKKVAKEFPEIYIKSMPRSHDIDKTGGIRVLFATYADNEEEGNKKLNAAIENFKKYIKDLLPES